MRGPDHAPSWTMCPPPPEWGLKPVAGSTEWQQVLMYAAIAVILSAPLWGVVCCSVLLRIRRSEQSELESRPKFTPLAFGTLWDNMYAYIRRHWGGADTEE